ncbi:MAG: cbb3-type cytochrome oxidase assembly protein CcoS [Ignavibacteriaceae bacterium]
MIAFLWSVKNGQYSDTYTPAVRILFDDENKTTNKVEEEKTESKTEKKS